MNPVAVKDLTVGQLCWYVEYAGVHPPDTTLIQILQLQDDEHPLLVKKVHTNETFEPFLIYAYLEEVHPKYIENKIKSLEDEQLRIAAELVMFKTLYEGSLK